MSLESYCRWGSTVECNYIFFLIFKKLGFHCRWSSSVFGVLPSPYRVEQPYRPFGNPNPNVCVEKNAKRCCHRCAARSRSLCLTQKSFISLYSVYHPIEREKFLPFSPRKGE